jgi:uncharacterized protein (DUF1330 family)
MPKAYIVAELHDVKETDQFNEYRQRVAATITAFGGRFLIRGGAARVLEGDGAPGTSVVVEFDSPKRAMAWYHSAEYQAILPLRLRNSTGRVICVTGVPPA